jgi:predicted SAM-dependent methyltransferase
MKRLNLGASRFERIPLKYIQMINDSSWIHLGDRPTSWQESFKDELSHGNLAYCARILYRAIKPIYTKAQIDSFYSATDFRGFYYRPGDRLDFEDETFDFIYSEHVLEHLFMDESLSLLEECCRILKPSGVIRIVVPDPDLRTYEKREPLSKLPINHPESHKTRWSVYSLPVIIKSAGLLPNPIMYCDRYGKFFQDFPTKSNTLYSNIRDEKFTFSSDYIQRLPSLIVDGLKI